MLVSSSSFLIVEKWIRWIGNAVYGAPTLVINSLVISFADLVCVLVMDLILEGNYNEIREGNEFMFILSDTELKVSARLYNHG